MIKINNMEETKKLFLTSIAGINFNATNDDIGPILGYVERDYDNAVDPRAVGIYRINGQRLGFIASKDLDDFYAFKGDGFDKMVFAGNIELINRKYGEEGFFVGNIAVIRSENEEELTKLIDQYMFDQGFKMYGETRQE